MFGQLDVVTGPAREPNDLELVRRHCRVDQNYDDELLEMYQAAARDWAERWLNRAMITQTLRYTFARSEPWTFATLERRIIPLPRAPAQSVVSVRMNRWWGDAAFPAELDRDYRVDELSGMLYFRSAPEGAAIEYVAGYGDAPADVPAALRHGVLMLTAYLYEGRGDVNSDGPAGAWQLMTPYRQWVFAG